MPDNTDDHRTRMRTQSSGRTPRPSEVAAATRRDMLIEKLQEDVRSARESCAHAVESGRLDRERANEEIEKLRTELTELTTTFKTTKTMGSASLGVFSVLLSAAIALGGNGWAAVTETRDMARDARTTIAAHREEPGHSETVGALAALREALAHTSGEIERLETRINDLRDSIQDRGYRGRGHEPRRNR